MNRCDPLSADAAKVDNILKQSFVTDEDKVDAITRYLSHIDKVKKFVTCSVSGIHNSPVLGSNHPKSSIDMHFYKVYPSGFNPYCKYWDYVDKLKGSLSKEDRGKYQRRKDILHIVDLRGEKYHL